MSAIEEIDIEVTKGDVDGETLVFLVQDNGTTKEMVLLASDPRPLRAHARASTVLDGLALKMHTLLDERRALASLPR